MAFRYIYGPPQEEPAPAFYNQGQAQEQNDQTLQGLNMLDRMTEWGSEGTAATAGFEGVGPSSPGADMGFAGAEIAAGETGLGATAGYSGLGAAGPGADMAFVGGEIAAGGGGAAAGGTAAAGGGTAAGGTAGAGGTGASGGSVVAAWPLALAALIAGNEYNARKTGDRPQATGDYLGYTAQGKGLKHDIESSGRFAKYTGGEDSALTADISAGASPAYANPKDQLAAYKNLWNRGSIGQARNWLGKVFG